MIKWKNMLALATGAGIAAITAQSPAALATGICDCCSGNVEEVCRAACEAGNTESGICRPVAFFGEAEGIGGEMPLNGFSFRNLSLDNASRLELEVLRRWLERERRKTERRARKSLRDYRRKRISVDEFTASQKVREEAIINYQHGTQKYIAAQ